VSRSEVRGAESRLRRRPTSRHRRNRLIRRALFLSAAGFFSVILFAIAVRHFGPSLFRSPQTAIPSLQQLEASRAKVLLANQDTFRPQNDRPVYPYSVVPGGVEDVRELKWVAEHDPVVGAHYAGFDYDHARVVRLVLARTVYLSYRIGNRVYWTRHRVTLHKGEKLITDGKITGRTRCANRVEELPQQAASFLEPPPAKFDEPLGARGTAVEIPPIPFQSALLPALEPTGPLSAYDPLTAENWVPIAPPPMPTGGVCTPPKKNEKEIGAELESQGKKKPNPCSAPETVPEPGTWVLVCSGIAAMFWHARRKIAQVS
jgi:PEP-CTERM motif-containing protein